MTRRRESGGACPISSENRTRRRSSARTYSPHPDPRRGKSRRLGLVEFLAAALGGVNQIGQRPLAVLQHLDPAILLLGPLGIGRRKLPGIEERLHQSLERIGTSLQRQEAPLPAVPEGCGPSVRRLGIFRPSLTFQRC